MQAHLSARAVGGISVKLRRTGITESLKIIALCEAAGIPMVIGTDFGIAHRRAAAGPSADGDPKPRPGADRDAFLRQACGDAFAGEFGFADGAITPSDAPGFGVAIDRRMLEKFRLLTPA